MEPNKKVGKNSSMLRKISNISSGNIILMGQFLEASEGKTLAFCRMRCSLGDVVEEKAAGVTAAIDSVYCDILPGYG